VKGENGKGGQLFDNTFANNTFSIRIEVRYNICRYRQKIHMEKKRKRNRIKINEMEKKL
jgi:hypothetical protein